MTEDGSKANFEITEILTEQPETEDEVANETGSETETSETATDASDEASTTEETTGEEESTTDNSNVASEETNTVSGENVSDSTNEIDLSVTSTTSDNLVNAEEISKKDVTNTTTDDTNTVVDDTNTSASVADNTTATETNTVAESSTAETTETNTTVSDEADYINSADTDTATDNTSNTTTDASEKEEELIDEEAVVNEQIESETETTNNTTSSGSISASITDINEITVESVTKATTLYLKVKFTQGETLDVNDLYRSLTAEFVGTYIDGDLNEVTISSNTAITVGWTYTKDIEVSSKYSKVAPFDVSGTTGTIVESRITVSRNIEDENYLPLKNTTLEIEVPNINGNAPTELNVSATRLMATRGEEIGETELTSDNWNYNAETGILTITVENTDAIYTYGDDLYVITYRYEDYVSESEISLQTNGTVSVEEYSGENNNIITKTIANEQTVTVLVGDLISYSIGTTDESINKGKINANYNSEEAVYETEFTSTITMDVLTNDILSEFTIKDTKEYYIDSQNIEFETTDVKYKQISFKYSEIAEMLEEGATIEVKSNAGELLYTLNSELITSQEQCELAINGDLTGIEISVKNISVNGTITVELLKSIGKCSYDKSAFANFEKLESRVKAEVKYIDSDEAIELSQIKATKYFEDSVTKAQVSLDRDTLSTLSLNEDVEVKIELYNDVETSDLYVNPVFEIVFPSYVTNVNAKMVNLLYENELTVKSATIYTNEAGLITMQIALEGTETKFSTGTLSNGTNIIINTDIEVDPYTPKTNDQIRMYYYNEGVTNYESQTKWTVSAGIPEGILKTTNGFDADVYSYNAPSGFVAVNGISNYADEGSEVVSIDQGEETVQIEMNQTFKVATMTLTAMNNTGNDCVDVVLMGRIPVEGATDVVTNEILGTNVDTELTSILYSSDKNSVAGTIYYSSNANATKDLSLASNGWTTSPENVREMKSYMIVLDGTVEAGTVLQYSYTFEIPENLPYETEIYGSFGAFYNNITSVAVVYESTDADMVGLVTETGAKLEASLSVDIGDGTSVLEQRMLTYTVTVTNTGSVDLEGVTITDPMPTYARLCVDASALDIGDDGYETSNDSSAEISLGTLAAGETVTETIKVRTTQYPKTLEEYYLQLGYVYDEDDEGERTYYTITNGETIYATEEYPETFYVENTATVTASNLATEITTNTVSNPLVEANFNINTVAYKDTTILYSGQDFEYVVAVQNITDGDLTGVIIEDVLPDAVTFTDFTDDIGYEYSYDSDTKTLQIYVGEMESLDSVKLYIPCEITNLKNTGSGTITNQFTVYADGGIEEQGTKISNEVAGPILTATLESALGSSNAVEYESFYIMINVKNTGSADSEEVTYKITIPSELEVQSAEGGGNRQVTVETDENIITGVVEAIGANQYSTLLIQVRPTVFSDGETSRTVTIDTAEVAEDYIGAISVNSLTITIDKNSEEVVTDEELAAIEEANTYSSEDAVDEDVDENEGVTDSMADSSDSSTTTTTTDTSSSSSDSSSNNTTTDTSDSSNTTDTSDSSSSTTASTGKVTGQVWLDENSDGQNDSSEEKLSSIKVTLQKNGNAVKAVTTDSTGTYRFSNVEDGTYTVVFEYDSSSYSPTTYKKQFVDEDSNSDAIEVSAGQAITDEFTISESEVELDFGLKKNDTFDLVTYKYLTKATVTTNGETKTYEYDDVDLAKIEVKAKYLNYTDIKFEYKIVVENVGNIAGTAQTVLDYLPEELTFNEEENTDWAVGDDGTLYNKSLKDVSISAGETKELTLVLNMAVTEDNTGTISNKAQLADLSSGESTAENSDNNSATQEVIVSVSTGGNTATIIIITILVVAIIIGITYKNRKNNFIKSKFK